MQTMANGTVKDCCKQESNLEFTRLNKDEVCNKCKVCGCRHFELTVDPIELGIKGKDTHAQPQPMWY